MQTLKNCIYEFLKLNNNTKTTKDNNIYHKLVVNIPFNNSNIILGTTKAKKGVYVWKSLLKI